MSDASVSHFSFKRFMWIVTPFVAAGILAFMLSIRLGPYSIWTAVTKNDSQQLDQLLAKWPNAVNSRNGAHFTPIHYAVLLGHTACVRVALQHGGDPNSLASYSSDAGPVTPIHQARNATTAKLLLDAGATVNFRDKQGRTELDRAKERGDEELIRLLESRGSKPGIELP